MVIKILGPGCPKCNELYKRVREVIDDFIHLLKTLVRENDLVWVNNS
jgi:hydrogenase maturation factor